MRKLIVRFRNSEDLMVLSNKLNIKLNKMIKEVDLVNNIAKVKKVVKKKGMRNTEWKEHWVDMPEFNIDFKDEVYAKIEFYIDDKIDIKIYEELFEQNISLKSTSIWFPKLKFGIHRDLRVVGGENPIYPVYIVSKNRYEYKSWHTSYRLAQMEVPHYLVVEPQEHALYAKNFNNKYVTVISMDMRYKDEYDCFSEIGNINSTGPGAARNFCWEHSVANGYKWHWVLDDNIDGFNRFWRGHRILSRTGETFRSCERFVERYENIAIAGLNYASFCKSGDRVPPYVLNTRIYSMLLIRNDIPYRWRGRYNEDTDLSLRVLKDNWCTIQFNLFLGEKLTTQKKKGGNTEEFYKKEGTIPKSQMLVEMHPDVAKMVYKFHRWHHYVDYSIFKQKLLLRNGRSRTNEKENGLVIVRIPKEVCNTTLDTKSYIENNFNNDTYRVDNTKIYL